MLNIFYGRESIDRDRFIFDSIKRNNGIAKQYGALQNNDTSQNNGALQNNGASQNIGGQSKESYSKSASTILLVPDQFSLQAEKDAFHYLEMQSLMDVDVLSFSRLSDRVIGETGGRRLPVIDKQGRHMLLTKVMNECAGDLSVYGKYRSSTSFLEMANNMISELKQCGITPDALDVVCGKDPGEETDPGDAQSGNVAETTHHKTRLLDRKLAEIAEIYRGYEKAIEGHYIDTEDIASLFVKNIQGSQTVRDSQFWVYGFDVFSPKNLDALEMLIKHSRGVNVVLTYDEGGRDEGLFAAVRETIERLESAAENVNIKANVQRIPGSYLCCKYDYKNRIDSSDECGADEPAACSEDAGNNEADVRKNEIEGTDAGELAHLESSLYAMPPEAYAGESSGQIKLVHASSVYAEAETAAAHVMHLVRDKGLAYRDIVMICNDKGARAEIYKQTFRRYGIRLFVDEKRSIAQSPAAVYVLALMKVIADGYKGEDVIRMLKTGLTDLDRSQIETLENYVTDYKINGAQWKSPFYKGKEDIDEEKFAELEELRQMAILPVMAFHEKYKSERTVAGKVMALYDFLEDGVPEDSETENTGGVEGEDNSKERIGVPEKLDELVRRQIERGELEKAAETAQVWNRLVGVLDQLVEILGEESIDAPSFYKLLESGIKAVEIGVLPPALDGLIMGSMQRTRSGHVKAVMVLAANEGILPMSAQSSGLLSDKERQVLMDASGRHLLKTDELRAAEERLAIYRNLSRPECELYMSMAESAEGSEAARPSLIFERIRKMFPDVPVEKDIFADGDPWDMIGSPESTIIHLTQAVKEAIDHEQKREKPIRDSRNSNSYESSNDEKGTDAILEAGDDISNSVYLPDIWKAIYKWYEEKRPEMLATMNKGLNYDGQVDKVEAQYVRDLYMRRRSGGADMAVSPTRLEKFSGCPFAHFLHYGLRARERRVYEVGGLEMGDMHHQCLDKYSRELNNAAAGSLTGEDSPWMSMTKDSCTTMVGRIMDDLAAGYREGLMHDSRAEEYRLKRMKSVCAESAWMMTEHMKRSAAVDMMCEAEFGRGKKLSPVEVETQNGTVVIEGKIDRMDIMPGNMVKIIDYKSGNETFDEKGARAGWKVQLMMYMRAAAENGFEPVASLYYNLKDPVVDVAKAKKDLEKALRSEFKMAGIILNEEEVIGMIDSDAAGGKKGGGEDGEQGKNGSKSGSKPSGKGRSASEIFVGGKTLRDRESFDELVGAVNDKIDEMCREIMDGDIRIRPKKSYNKTAVLSSGKSGSLTACSYCPYHSVCKFDTQFKGCEYEYV